MYKTSSRNLQRRHHLNAPTKPPSNEASGDVNALSIAFLEAAKKKLAEIEQEETIANETTVSDAPYPSGSLSKQVL